jgi:hypothetical protein
MTQKRKTILILFLVFLVFVILSKTGLLNLSLYSSNVTSSVSGNWSNSVSIANISPGSLVDKPCTDSTGLKNVPVLVYCMGYKKEEKGTGNCPPVSVSIDHIDHGPLWIPLYNNCAFHCTVPITRSVSSYRQIGDSIQLHNYTINGTITLNGELTIKGLCSYKDAKRMIADNAMNTVYNAVRAQLDEQK